MSPHFLFGVWEKKKFKEVIPIMDLPSGDRILFREFTVTVYLGIYTLLVGAIYGAVEGMVLDERFFAAITERCIASYYEICICVTAELIAHETRGIADIDGDSISVDRHVFFSCCLYKFTELLIIETALI